MNIRKLTILVLGLMLVPVVALLLVRLFYRPSQPVETFRAILNLTPGELEMNCGMPALDTIGVMDIGAGIQDLHYGTSGSDEIVFRFITEDDKTWQSLGAWERVNAVDLLGVPVSAPEAVRRQGCAGKGGSQAALLPLMRGKEAGGWMTALAAMLSPQAMQEMLAPAQHGPPPMPSTLPKGAAMSPAAPQQNPYVIQVPGSGFVLPPRSLPYSDPGDSGIVHATLPCPPGAVPCLMVDYAAFTNGMNGVIHEELNNNFVAAVDRLTRHGTIVVKLPFDPENRAAALSGVLRLEVRAVNIVEARLRDDLIRMEPVERDSTELKAKKMTALLHDDQVRRLLWKQAIASNIPAATVLDPHTGRGSGNTLPFNTDAYRQMVQIHLTGNWP
jgi:hypothetical protein